MSLLIPSKDSKFKQIACGLQNCISNCSCSAFTPVKEFASTVSLPLSQFGTFAHAFCTMSSRIHHDHPKVSGWITHYTVSSVTGGECQGASASHCFVRQLSFRRSDCGAASCSARSGLACRKVAKWLQNVQRIDCCGNMQCIHLGLSHTQMCASW